MNTNPFGFPISVPGAKSPVRMWSPLHEVDHEAQNQIRNVSRLPWTHGVAIMPDVHAGSGVTVGSVIAMKDAVSPAAVGADIGCGMMAVKTTASLADLPDNLGSIRSAWEAAVPVGFSKHENHAPAIKRDGLLRQEMKNLYSNFNALRVDVSALEHNSVQQCGTLGGGNHFIELCADTDGSLWVMLHSGSRNIGKEIAERHIYRAKHLEWNSDIPDRNLAVFLRRDDTGREYPQWSDYLHDLYWAQHYAVLNRRVMMAAVKHALTSFLPAADFIQEINCHHNYVTEETYDGMDLVITRKGAISARKGEFGIIPGSMGTGSYIVRGLGNLAAFNSASHGAGRKMSRGQARQHFTLDDLITQTKGVECRKDSGVLDELPGAYKDLSQVIQHEADLVEVVTKLDTLLCVKG